MAGCKLLGVLADQRHTRMVQDVFADDDRAAQLTDADQHGLTPLFWTHVAPYGEVNLDLSARLALSGDRSDRPKVSWSCRQADSKSPWPVLARRSKRAKTIGKKKILAQGLLIAGGPILVGLGGFFGATR